MSATPMTAPVITTPLFCGSSSCCSSRGWRPYRSGVRPPREARTILAQLVFLLREGLEPSCNLPFFSKSRTFRWKGAAQKRVGARGSATLASTPSMQIDRKPLLGCTEQNIERLRGLTVKKIAPLGGRQAQRMVGNRRRRRRPEDAVEVVGIGAAVSAQPAHAVDPAHLTQRERQTIQTR